MILSVHWRISIGTCICRDFLLQYLVFKKVSGIGADLVIILSLKTKFAAYLIASQ